MHRLLVPALALALAAAGCIEVPASTTDGDPEGPRVGWLTTGFALVENAPAPGAVETGGFFGSWASGSDYPTWLADPVAEDMLVETLSIRLVVTSTGPVLETARFPDIMVYGGGGDSWLGYNSTQTPSVLVPGEVHAFEFPLDLPEGGLWVPAGESVGVKVVPVMFQEDGNDVQVLVGPDGSRVEWTQRALGSAPRPPGFTTTTGELQGSAYAGEAAPESTSHRTPVELGPGTQALVAWMNVTAHQGIPDVDLALEAPDGSVVAFSGTPTPRESILLAAPALTKTGTYQLVVTSYGSANAAFSLTWGAA